MTCPTINSLVEQRAATSPDHLAFTGFGGDISYRELVEGANKVANQLIEAGFGKEMKFALLMPNCGAGVVAQLGALKIGGAWCNVNLRNSIADNIDILSRGSCHVLFFHSAVQDVAAEVFAEVPSMKLRVCVDSGNADAPFLDDWTANASTGEPAIVAGPEDSGLQGSTGGTTGQPKLTESSNWFLTKSAMAFDDCMPCERGHINLAIAPITHAGGILCLGVLVAGGTNIMVAAPDLGEILNSLETENVTTVFLPPTLVYMLLQHPEVRAKDYSSLVYFITMGAPMAPGKIIECNEVFGPVMCQALGQTEAGVPLTYISPEEVAEAIATNPERLASCGRKTMLISDLATMDDDGNLLAAGEQGEIVMRGDALMKGYLNDAAATQEIQKGGWHHTGDIGYLDADGFLYINDRKRDMIISGGFNIFPFEVEKTLVTHPAVQECAVFGLPDEKWGERVVAAIEPTDGSNPDAEQIIQFCKDEIGSMKAPKQIEFVDALPRSAVGKVLKRVIRAELIG